MVKLGIIGGGKMGAAIIQGAGKSYSIAVCEKDNRRLQYLQRRFKVTACDLPALVLRSRVILLAVKPQDADRVLKAMAEYVTKSSLIISIAAGITASFIEKRLGPGVRIVRTMPNMPASICEGITAISKGRYARAADLKTAEKIFSGVGNTVIVKENLIDAITAVSGSGPAYVFLFSECLEKAARSVGLNRSLSAQLVEATLLGSVHLLINQPGGATTLRARVTSKGGTTQAAMDVFKKYKLDRIITQAVTAAKRRARKLSRS